MTDPDLTPDEIDVALEAASRFGKSNPTFCDIIDRLVPEYSNGTREPCADFAKIRRWHRVSTYALHLVGRGVKMRTTYAECIRPGCNRTVGSSQQKYCSTECADRSLNRTPPTTEVCPQCRQRQKSVRASVCRVCWVPKPKVCDLEGCTKICANQRNKYCSNKCKGEARAKFPTCSLDGCEVRVKRAGARYCSRSCATRDRENDRCRCGALMIAGNCNRCGASWAA